MPKPLNRGKLIARKPFWTGPENEGIGYSLLCKFLQCRERFRMRVVEGLVEDQGFSYYMEFGSMWHECEEAHAANKPWRFKLDAYCQKLCGTYPESAKEIDKWHDLTAMLFPIYVQRWLRDYSNIGRKPVYQEKVFHVPYIIPDGRTVYLNGKFDSVFFKNKMLVLQENKTKGDIDQEQLSKTVDQNLQTMLYLIALGIFELEQNGKRQIGGTLYNVVRRPLSDRHSPRQKKKESFAAFVERIGKLTTEKLSHHFFRWPVDVPWQKIDRFRRVSFDPILTDLCNWWDVIKRNPFSEVQPSNHFRFPFGVYHSMERGFKGDYFNYYTSGSRDGLVKITTLFPELK